jgi:hypothetical protein
VCPHIGAFTASRLSALCYRLSLRHCAEELGR